MATKEQHTATIAQRDLNILRAVFVTAFAAAVAWAGNRLVSTSVSESLITKRDSEISLINERIASIEAHIRVNCKGETK